jgi:hypothetical protein
MEMMTRSPSKRLNQGKNKTTGISSHITTITATLPTFQRQILVKDGGKFQSLQFVTV